MANHVESESSADTHARIALAKMMSTIPQHSNPGVSCVLASPLDEHSYRRRVPGPSSEFRARLPAAYRPGPNGRAAVGSA
jgi:hypothetical protein